MSILSNLHKIPMWYAKKKDETGDMTIRILEMHPVSLSYFIPVNI